VAYPYGVSIGDIVEWEWSYHDYRAVVIGTTHSYPRTLVPNEGPRRDIRDPFKWAGGGKLVALNSSSALWTRDDVIEHLRCAFDPLKPLHGPVVLCDGQLHSPRASCVLAVLTNREPCQE
jgi:hypothetical protein